LNIIHSFHPEVKRRRRATGPTARRGKTAEEGERHAAEQRRLRQREGIAKAVSSYAALHSRLLGWGRGRRGSLARLARAIELDGFAVVPFPVAAVDFNSMVAAGNSNVQMGRLVEDFLPPQIFTTFRGSSPENRHEGIARDFMYEAWQQHMRRLPGPVLAEAWPNLDEKGQGAKKTGPTLTAWPTPDHSKFSSKHHFSSWMWDALNKCALQQYNPSAAMNHLLSHISTPQTQQQIRKVLNSMGATLKTADDFDKFYHAVLVTLPETSPTEVEARGKLSDLRPTPDETVIEYYVRFTSVASLVINAVDYGQYATELSQAQLQLLFAETLTKADRAIDMGKLSNWLTEDTLEPRKRVFQYFLSIDCDKLEGFLKGIYLAQKKLFRVQYSPHLDMKLWREAQLTAGVPISTEPWPTLDPKGPRGRGTRPPPIGQGSGRRPLMTCLICHVSSLIGCLGA